MAGQLLYDPSRSEGLLLDNPSSVDVESVVDSLTITGLVSTVQAARSLGVLLANPQRSSGLLFAEEGGTVGDIWSTNDGTWATWATVWDSLNVEAGVFGLNITEQLSAVNFTISVEAITGSLTITPQLATVELPVGISTITDTLAISEQIADINASRLATTIVDELNITTYDAYINNDLFIVADTAALSVTANNIAQPATVSTHALSIDWFKASVSATVGILASKVSLNIKTYAADILRNLWSRILDETNLWSGIDDKTTVWTKTSLKLITASLATLTVTPLQATVTGNPAQIDAITDSLDITTNIATIGTGSVIFADTDSLDISEQLASINYHVKVGADTPALEITENISSVQLGIHTVTDTLSITEQDATITLPVSFTSLVDALVIAEIEAHVGTPADVGALLADPQRGQGLLLDAPIDLPIPPNNIEVLADTDNLFVTENTATVTSPTVSPDITFTEDFSDGDFSKWDTDETDWPIFQIVSSGGINGNTFLIPHTSGSSNSGSLEKAFGDNEVYSNELTTGEKMTRAVHIGNHKVSSLGMPVDGSTKVTLIESWPSDTYPSTTGSEFNVKQFQAILEITQSAQLVLTIKRFDFDFYTLYPNPVINVVANQTFNYELEIVLNDFGSANGIARLTIDDVLVINSTTEEFDVDGMAKGLNMLFVSGFDGGSGASANFNQYWDDFELYAYSGSVSLFAPVITSQPSPDTVSAGGVGEFHIAATGNPSPDYQWRENGIDISDNSVYTGTDTPDLFITTTDQSLSGNVYSCFVFNPEGNTSSNSVQLTVTQAGTSNIIFEHDFEDGTWKGLWHGGTGSDVACGQTQTSITTEQFHSGTRCAKVDYSGGCNLQHIILDNISNSIDRELYVRFWYYFHPNYEIDHNHKFMRITESQTSNFQTNVEFYGVDIYFSAGGRVNTVPETKPFGNSPDTQVYTVGGETKGVWHEWEFYGKLNTQGSDDGDYKLWIDGTQKINRVGNWTWTHSGANPQSTQYKWNTVFFPSNYADGPPGGSTPIYYIDDIQVRDGMP